ncbi:MAG: two-component sensor histidine kinase [Paraburkholderia sp.]|uniref:ATP-binding protein n=1 Tax=Paraburkholderia sp. TaxID=1926495 RepID=UPI001212EB7A|nr:ATP-binding protein [Paraburkholderia sp.]TAM05836.1 MAG: two-component sensor histidine kinase [Paraburkholderia sp.]
MKLPRSLQGRLLVLVTGVVAAVWLVASALTWQDARREIDRLLDSHLAQAAALLVMQQAQAADDDETLDAPILHPYAPKVVFQVFHEGRLGMHSANAPAQPMVPPQEKRVSGFWTVQIDGNAWRVFATPGAQHDVEVYVGERIDSRTSILMAVMRSAFWPMAGALPVLALVTWWAVRRGAAPLRDLGSMLARRDPRALDAVQMNRAPQEMQPMLDALNRLFDRIRAVLDAERRFTADAAHELRTPIAAIKAQAQVAMGENNPALRRHALSGVLEGCDCAVHLVDQLLLLSRLEAGAPTGDSAAVDLGTVAKQVVADIAPQSIGKLQQLELEAPERCVVTGNKVLLASLIRNLVDNAVRYSPPRARILVSVHRRDGHVMLAVEDSGPGLPDDDLQRLGDRFFRARGSGQSGSGLGWSIVRRIASVHGAAIRVGRSSALGGLRVDVSWFGANALDDVKSNPHSVPT